MKIIINNEVSITAKDVEIMEGISSVDKSIDLFIRIVDAEGRSFIGMILKEGSISNLKIKVLLFDKQNPKI